MQMNTDRQNQLWLDLDDSVSFAQQNHILE